MTPSKSMPHKSKHDFKEKYHYVRVSTLVSTLCVCVIVGVCVSVCVCTCLRKGK